MASFFIWGFWMYCGFHFCISGFTQNRGYCHGILKLREELIEAGHYFDNHARVAYWTWDMNFDLVASELQIVCTRAGVRPVVGIYGYSYGGWGSLKFARALDNRGIDVREMVLSDPVGRPWFWPAPLPAATSMLSREYAFALTVPANVENCKVFYQRGSRPQGHRVVARMPSVTDVKEKELKGYTHVQMDDAQEFHDAVLESAGRIGDFVAAHKV